MQPQRTNVAGRTAQPYDERFPDAATGFETDEGMARAFREFECEVCCRKTAWVHSQLAVYLCSRDCLTLYEQQQGI